VNIEIQTICQIAKEAGKRILKIYGQADFQLEKKKDNSPLTEADRASHQLIESELKKQYPGIPILSEEGKAIPYELRKGWARFWIVDPLDGTKEFIRRNGEFTVNIALLENGIITLGVIDVPVPDIQYFAQRNQGAFRQQGAKEVESISVDPDIESRVTAVRSRSHASPEEEAYAVKVGCDEIISAGSSLKFCRVAEGLAHYYYRHGPTMEWDTAAGQVIAETAGAVVSGLRYNKTELRNGSFLVRSTEKLPDIF
jgi:3'(2'), 5'-bisphosphate nucleotidase